MSLPVILDPEARGEFDDGLAYDPEMDIEEPIDLKLLRRGAGAREVPTGPVSWGGISFGTRAHTSEP